MTCLILKQRELLVISPFPVKAVQEDLNRLGEVKFIIAPNDMHHLWVLLLLGVVKAQEPSEPRMLKFTVQPVAWWVIHHDSTYAVC
jgi:hypothetical protein